MRASEEERGKDWALQNERDKLEIKYERAEQRKSMTANEEGREKERPRDLERASERN